MNKNKPFLKWAGNKYRCLEQILSAFTLSQRLIEPFTGSGAVFMNSNAKHFLLAEQNYDLINLYTLVQQLGVEFIDYCERYFEDRYNNETEFYRLRELFNRSKHSRKRAALFVYLNRHAYNGLCRYNQSGNFNVPFGRYKKPYFPRKEMLAFYQQSQRAEFLHADFRTTFKQAVPGDLIYCDPPYVALSASANFSAYTRQSFSNLDQITLAKLAMKSAKKGINVIISNHDTEFTREQYRQASIVSFPVQRLISCKANQRHRVQELLAVFKG